MDSEDKKLTKLMESVIPKHLVGRMREDILSPHSDGIFHRIYLDSYDDVSILFADIVNFTKISSNCSAQLLVVTLNELFGRFDKAADRNHCLRIKILGDCYYCVSGIPDMNKEHAIRSVEMGLDMIDILAELAQDNSVVDLNMRVGIHSGRVLCGVLGKKKWQFDVHSNDVKLANHIEQSGIPGKVHITEDTLRALAGRYQVEPAKGHLRDTYIAQRNIATYFVMPPAGRRSSLARPTAARPQTDEPPLPVGAQVAPDATGLEVACPLAATAVTLKTCPAGQQQAKLRFRLATQRIINALHFIRTIEAPFANLDVCSASPAPTRPSQVEHMMRETIEARVGIHDIHRLTLGFKDRRMSSLYWQSGRPAKQLKSLLLCLACLLLFGLTLLITCDLGRASACVELTGQLVLLFLLVLLVYCHQLEYNERRQFLWRHKLSQDQQRVALIRDCNKFIFFNLLPPHVASYFLEQRLERNHMDLYHKSYERIGVIFATISNFSDFYSEVQGNNHGLECLRLLNEIICDFDTILDDQRFRAVDKIKTIGSTYMAAIGLFPEHQLPTGPIERGDNDLGPGEADSQAACVSGSFDDPNQGLAAIQVERQPVHERAQSGSQQNDCDNVIRKRRAEVAKYLKILVSFVIEMKARLQDINEHSYNSFKLRAGINLGPVTAGVVGASKPLYDIWGNTVNVASRMESTAESSKIQITEEVYLLLDEFNQDSEYTFTCRGRINVKGKGFMTTYYIDKNNNNNS